MAVRHKRHEFDPTFARIPDFKSLEMDEQVHSLDLDNNEKKKQIIGVGATEEQTLFGQFTLE